MGEDGRFAVNLSELENAVQELRKLTEAVDDKLAELSHRNDALHLDWTGHAAVAHREARELWAKAATDMAAGLEGMHESAAYAHSIYTAAVTANVEMFR